ncbi:hypothetical protein BN874_90009 [Candidatus Contendobacter odensis Run_B_J11]|uniref:Uncharacterized protein n=2 Tax=Candidatus Contendibacter odensensis TaxID=1400860 RepID=A0A7U7GGG3_9GAMM|nr:hypothetical protein BN874_90009 [Candidatus Contendobacter odensis Run_B_J11]
MIQNGVSSPKSIVADRASGKRPPSFVVSIQRINDHAAAELRKRTLTHRYNQRQAWLANAHRVLDEAVAAAYRWPADLSDEEMLRWLLALNRERVNAQTT